MIKKIVHVAYSSLTPLMAEALYIPQCQENNIDVEWLDLSDIFGFPPNHHSEKYKSLIFKPKNAEELTSYLGLLESSSVLVNIQFYFEWRYVNFFKILAKTKLALLSTFAMGDIPLYPAVSSTRLKKLLSPHFLVKRITQMILFKIYVKKGKIKLPEIYFCAARNRPPFVPKKAKYFPINYVDYDRYVRARKSITIKEKHITFLDISFANHPDLNFFGIKLTAEAKDEYRRNINDFFNFLEKKYSANVVIAAHPKSNYSDDYFDGRPIIKNDVLNLVSHSLLVVGHHSTSTSYAVISRKPIIFFYDNVIQNNSQNLPLDLFIKTFAKLTHSPCINISNPYDNLEIPSVDEDIYTNFLQSYLIGENLEDKDSADAFLGYIKNLKA